MKTFLLAIVLVVCSTQMSYSQEQDGVVSLALPVRNSLKFNRFVVNPTFSFVRQQDRYFSITNKREWVQFEDAPQTYLASYSGRFTEDSGLGIGLFQQNYGVLTTFGGIVNFAYNARLARDSNLTFGLNVGAYKSGINSANVVTNFPDPSLENIPSNFLLTINPGINYGTGFLDFGLSINNLALFNTSKLVENNPEQGVQAHIMYTGYTDIGGFFDESRFSSLIRSEFKKDKTVISGIAMFMVPRGIWAQVGYSNLYGGSAGLGLNITKEIAIEYNFEKALGDLTEFGPSHEITLAYKFKNNDRFDYSREDDVSALFSGDKKRKPVSEVDKAQADANRKLAVETKAQAKLDAEAKAQAKAEEKAQAKLEADNKAKAEAASNKEEEVKAKLDAAAAKVEADALAKEVAEAKAKIAADNKAKIDAKAKADAEAAKRAEAARAEAQSKLEAENKAKEDAKAEASKLAEASRLKAEAAAKAKADAEAARLAEMARVKAEVDAKAKEDAKLKEVAQAEAEKLKLEEETRVKAEIDAKAKIAAESKAKEDAEMKAKADAEAKLQQENKVREIEEARLASLAQAKLDAEAKATADAKANEALIQNPADALGKSMNSVEKLTKDSEVEQAELLKKYSEAIADKDKDLKDLKEENDLSDKGVFMEPKPFKSVTAENNALDALKIDLDQVIGIRNDRIKELEKLYDERLKIYPLVNDEVNLYYQKAIKKLKAEQLNAIQTRTSLTANLDQIKEATEFERKRRIKRAAFDSEQDRYQQDRNALSIIKQNTKLSTVPLKVDDFDFGQEQSGSIQILKNVKNIDNGYYLIVAVHNDISKRDEFLTKTIASGRSNIDFFYDVNTSKYYIYYDRFDSVEEANEALKSKGDRPYNVKMSLVKIEN